MVQRRKALSNQGGTVQSWGERDAAHALARALASSAEPADRLTHGFHTYPARMHPAIAGAVIEELTARGAHVLDPFCGSGTVLVEAFVAGRRAIGVDLSPLALRIAETHVAIRDAEARTRFEQTLARVAEASTERVRARRRARAPLPPRDRSKYAPHVLLELAGLLDEVRAIEDSDDRRACEMVVSSLLVKLSKLRGDTADEIVDKRLRKGLATELFLRKGRELARRWADLAEALPRDAHPPRVVPGDARDLATLFARGPRFELVLTSPPYGGTYDYYTHQALRCAWLGLDARTLQAREVGARRALSRAHEAARRWDDELRACLRAMAAVTARAGRIVLLLGDGQVGRHRIDAGRQVATLAPKCGLTLRAAANQHRADRRGGPPRREHLLWLERAPTWKPRRRG